MSLILALEPDARQPLTSLPTDPIAPGDERARQSDCWLGQVISRMISPAPIVCDNPPWRLTVEGREASGFVIETLHPRWHPTSRPRKNRSRPATRPSEAQIAECDAEIEEHLGGLNDSRPVPSNPLPAARHAKALNEMKFETRPALYTWR